MALEFIQIFRIPKNYFNLTMTFRPDSDFLHFYGRMIPVEQESLYPQFKRYDWSRVKSIVLSKTKSIFKVYSKCKTPNKREDYIKELAK